MTPEEICTCGMIPLQAVFFAALEPAVRPEMWPFLLHYYPYNSTFEERERLRNDKYIEYQNIRKARLVKVGTCAECVLSSFALVNTRCSFPQRIDVRRGEREVLEEYTVHSGEGRGAN